MVERELLHRYGAIELLEEWRTWEALRERLRPPRYEPPQTPSRTLILLDGIPGAGKSTTVQWLKPAVGATWLSMARFAGAAGVSRDERMAHEFSTHAPHPVDFQFLAAIDALPGAWVLLEKFPRSVVEAIALLDAVHANGWRFEVLHLQLPGDCVARSVERQLARGPRHGVMPTHESATHRALAHLARAPACRETLRDAGVPIHTIDTSEPRSKNEADVRRSLGLDFERLDWHREPLEVLEGVSERLGIEAWVANGHLSRAFWNNVFGPAQRPNDVDVAVNEEHEVKPLLDALEATAPGHRWSVAAPATRQQELGLETRSMHEAKSLATFVHRSGLVRWRRGVPELWLPEGTEAALRQGVVALNPRLVERLSPPALERHLQQKAWRVPRVLRDYPGLTAQPPPGIDWPHVPRVIHASWRALKQDAPATGSRSTWNRRSLHRDEERIAQEVLQFHREHPPRPEAPPRPPPRPTPSGDFVTLAAEAADADFATWLLHQSRRHHETHVDAWLGALLDFSLFGPRLSAGPQAQSAMHQGWLLDQHLLESAVQLRLDPLALEPEERLAMRVAMLFHDTGKLAGPRPNRHATISAALFARHRPDWFPERLMGLTQWLIRTHDLFGVFGRGLTEKRGHPVADYALDVAAPSSYGSALDAQALRHGLRDSGLPLARAAALHKAVWVADVGSIASLRWLIPTADLVERLVLVRERR